MRTISCAIIPRIGDGCGLGKRHDVANVVALFDEHVEAFETECNPGTLWETGAQGVEEVLVGVRSRLTSPATLVDVCLHPFGLFFGVGEFDEAVRKFDIAYEDFESVGDCRVIGIAPCERGLADRVVADDRERVARQTRRNSGREQQVEPVVPPVAQ